ncbi:RHOMBOID-like 1 isoform 1 [Hibiscus syriacus]|uniref:RHOMBOID-like 1 isoform 1 n=1 Tax=Hibiscus syriacus TaxID=106335 RepID=A0A6A2ZXK4_HIBSY|nr:RHOMBOID-like 1 isoform 1 [Hibiscus syriacus]
MSTETLMEKPTTGKCRCRTQSWYTVFISFLLWFTLYMIYLYSSSVTYSKREYSLTINNDTDVLDSSESFRHVLRDDETEDSSRVGGINLEDIVDDEDETDSETEEKPVEDLSEDDEVYQVIQSLLTEEQSETEPVETEMNSGNENEDVAGNEGVKNMDEDDKSMKGKRKEKHATTEQKKGKANVAERRREDNAEDREKGKDDRVAKRKVAANHSERQMGENVENRGAKGKGAANVLEQQKKDSAEDQEKRNEAKRKETANVSDRQKRDNVEHRAATGKGTANVLKQHREDNPEDQGKRNETKRKETANVETLSVVKNKTERTGHPRRETRNKPVDSSDPVMEKRNEKVVVLLRIPQARSDPCLGRYIYIHNLPRKFNQDLLETCQSLSFWTDICKCASNLGLGASLPRDDKLYSGTGWFNTNQFLLEVIFRNRMKQYKCLTKDPSFASAIYVPYYAGLDVGHYLWDPDGFMRDYDAFNLVKRDPKNESDWGNELLNFDKSRNMPTLVLESCPWNYNDFAIPYPTYFHPSRDSEVFQCRWLLKLNSNGVVIEFKWGCLEFKVAEVLYDLWIVTGMSGQDNSRDVAGNDRLAEGSNSPALARQGEGQTLSGVPVQDQDVFFRTLDAVLMRFQSPAPSTPRRNIAKDLKGLGAPEFKGEVEESPVEADFWLNYVKIMLDGLHCSDMEKLDGVAPCFVDKREYVPTEKDTCEWFVEGLRPRLKEMLIVLNLSSFQEVVNHAKALERAQNERYGDQRVQSFKRTGPSSSLVSPKRSRDSDFRSQARSESMTSSARGSSQMRDRQTQFVESGDGRAQLRHCQNCGRYHGGICRIKSGACFRCGEIGHFMRDCPLNDRELAQSERSVLMSQRGRGRGRERNQTESSTQQEMRSTARIYNLNDNEDCEDPELLADSWNATVTAVSSSSGNNKLKFDDVRDLVLSEEIRRRESDESSTSSTSCIDRVKDLQQSEDGNYLYSFISQQRRPGFHESFRNELIDQCLATRRRCKFLEYDKTQKFHKAAYLLKLFQSSIFCLQPSGDSYTRRSISDSIVAGCIPVFFHPGSAYVQYIWHFPKDSSKYSVFIPERDVKSGKANIERILQRVSRERRATMRDEVINMIPSVIYANPSSRLRKTEDAFDLTVKGVLDRIETVRNQMKEGKIVNYEFDEEESWKYFAFGKLGPHEWDIYFSRKNGQHGP